jgi:hypothetical protein
MELKYNNVYELNSIKVNRKPLYELQYDKKEEEYYTTDFIKEQCIFLNNHLQKKNFKGYLIVETFYTFGNRCGQSNVKVGPNFINHLDELIYPIEEIYDGVIEWIDRDIHNFNIYMIPQSVEVGDNKNKYSNVKKYGKNNCLYWAISELVGNRMSLITKSPEDFRQFLGVDECSKINLDEIQDKLYKFEELESIKIIIRGDFLYNKTHNAKHNARRILNLLSKDDHISIDKENTINKPKIFKIPKNSKKQLSLFRGSKDDIENIDEDKYFYVRCPKEFENLTLDEAQDKYINDAKEFYEITKFIDITKFNFINECILYYFYKFTKTIPNPSKLDTFEEHWINDTYLGGLIYFSNQPKNIVYDYDIDTFYGSILINPHSMFPINEGTFKKIDELPKYIKYGIYRCNITLNNTEQRKLFRINKNNKYTHLDLQVARDLNLNIELIKDNEYNCLEYSPKDLWNGSLIFKSYIKYFIYSKHLKNSFSKIFINNLIGILCQKKYKKYNTGYSNINLNSCEEVGPQGEYSTG